MERSAQWLAEKLRTAGFPTVEVLPTAGRPAVYAEWPSGDPGAPTVLVYGHHDVQPVGSARAVGHRRRSSRCARRATGELVGRGAIDDKGQVLFHLLGLRAHLAATGRTSPAVNLKLLVEGEEESGSTELRDAAARAQRERLRCDVVVVSDTGDVGRRHDHGVHRDARPGRVPARPARPATATCTPGPSAARCPTRRTVAGRLVAALHDADGRVTLPGFYDGVAS